MIYHAACNLWLLLHFMAFMTLHRPGTHFAVTSLAKIVGNPLIKACHRMCPCGCFCLVAGNAGFCFHYSLMSGVIETNIALGCLENKITILCVRIDAYGIFVFCP